ncbi:hypothetical protein LB544_14215 [Mesorhizobium sp. CO1-1-9]|nr:MULTISPECIES: glutathione binding-like protein [unclassified Mesorhizobium]MBZ9696308.1 hypothetical protein [Mesorhizobium sp. CO1-1-9]
MPSRKKPPVGPSSGKVAAQTMPAAPCLAGSDFTVADIAVYAYSHRAGDCGFSLADYPAFAAWTERVRDAIGPGYPVHPYGIDPHSGA